jgi:hypothetical protein
MREKRHLDREAVAVKQANALAWVGLTDVEVETVCDRYFTRDDWEVEFKRLEPDGGLLLRVRNKRTGITGSMDGRIYRDGALTALALALAHCIMFGYLGVRRDSHHNTGAN